MGVRGLKRQGGANKFLAPKRGGLLERERAYLVGGLNRGVTVFTMISS